MGFGVPQIEERNQTGGLVYDKKNTEITRESAMY